MLVIDVNEGVQENSRRHGYMLSMLGVRDVIVLVNKMDLEGYSEKAFADVVAEYRKFLEAIEIKPRCFIPASGLLGDGIAARSAKMGWYGGRTLLEELDALSPDGPERSRCFRMFVQDVYKFTKFDDTRRIVAGTIDSGRLRAGDEIIFYPSAKKSTVSSLECFNGHPRQEQGAGEACGFTLTEQVYVARGELAVVAGESRPQITTRLRVSLFWLGADAFLKNKSYLFKLGTAKVPARLEQIIKVIDASDLSSHNSASMVERNQVAECIIQLNKAIACDSAAELSQTSRFVIVDGFRIAGGGIIREALKDEHTEARERTLRRNTKWIESLIAPEDRAEKYSQRPTLVLITGERQVDRKRLGKALEAQLFAEGRVVYFLGIGNILHGLDADLEGLQNTGREHIRRLAELANLMLNAGLLLVVSAADLAQQDLELIGELVGEERVKSVWFGPEVTTDLVCDLHLNEPEDLEGGIQAIKEMLYAHQILFRPW